MKVFRSTTLFLLVVTTLSLTSLYVSAQDERGLPNAEAKRPPCRDWDKYLMRTQISEVILSSCALDDPSMGGLRPYLYEHGWGIQSTALTAISYDVLGHDYDSTGKVYVTGAKRKTWYGGQRPTGSAQEWTALTYDLSRLGVPGNAQFAIRGAWFANSYIKAQKWMGINQLAINHQFNKGAVELQYGFGTMVHQMYGAILGGNAALAAFGPNSNALGEAGLSVIPAPTPAIQLVLRNPSTRHFYTNIGATRSTALQRNSTDNPLNADAAENPQGIKFMLRGSRMVLFDEIGYDKGTLGYLPSQSTDTRALWLRAGAAYNFSKSPTVANFNIHGNEYVWYAAATVALKHFGNNYGRRGLYLDAKCDYTPPSLNEFAHDYNVTLYTQGLGGKAFAGDMMSIAWSQTYFSSYYRAAMLKRYTSAAHTSGSYVFSYSRRIFPGSWFVAQLNETIDPNVAPVLPAAFIMQGTWRVAF